MNHKILIVGVAAALLAFSAAADAQGRSGGAGGKAGSRPMPGQQRDMGAMQQQRAEVRRLEKVEAARLKAEEAQRKRLEAEANNASEQARTDHAPGEEHGPNEEHAAPEAFIAEGNAENQNLREERRDRQGDNRGEHGPDSDE